MQDTYLEPEQTDLLFTLAEAEEQVPRNAGEAFYLLSGHLGQAPLVRTVLHKGFPEGKLDIHIGDLDHLVAQGLVTLSASGSGAIAELTPFGRRYVRVHRLAGAQQAERVEAEIARYLDGAVFQQRFPAAYGKWKSAADAYVADAETNATRIGHDCREALSIYASSLAAQHAVPVADNAGTVTKIRAVLDEVPHAESGRLGQFLQALLAYWGTVSDLAQRQEHGATKEGEALVAEDARRLVFQTAIVMYEIDRAVSHVS